MIKIKLIFFTTFLSLFGQSSGYQSSGASANLLMPLSIETGIGDLDFGEILVSGSSSEEIIQPRNGKEFVVRGEAHRNITVIFNDVDLTNILWLSNHSGENGNLTFEPNVTTDNLKQVKSGNSVNLLPNGLVGERKFYVGGSIQIKPNQPSGDYEGIFVISVSY